jgi:hypothetical protein
MGEIADAMLGGELCATCGVYMDPEVYGPPKGAPRKCLWCARGPRKRKHKEKR